MSDRVDRAFDDLRAALTIEPSRRFAPRVRTEVARRSARRRRTSQAGIGLALAASLAAVMVAENWRTAGLAPPAVAPAIRSAPAIPKSPPVHAATRRQPGARRAATAPLVLVPDDQAIALNQLLRAWSQGRAALPSEPDPAEAWPGVTELPAIAPIEIPLLPGTPADPIERNPR